MNKRIRDLNAQVFKSLNSPKNMCASLEFTKVILQQVSSLVRHITQF